MSGALVALVGLLGLFGWMMGRLPQEVVMGMLAGVLLGFGIDVFGSFLKDPVLVGSMVLSYLVAQWTIPRVPPVLAALLVGAAMVGFESRIELGMVDFSFSVPLPIAPAFNTGALFSIGLPLTLLALVSQNAPGIGILRANGYDPPPDAVTVLTGVGSVLIAPLLGHGVNVAAPMTAICATPDADPDPDKRYAAAVVGGVTYAAFGLLGASAIPVIEALPKAFVAAVAGLALLPIMLQAFRLSLGAVHNTAGAFFALLIAMSGLSVFGVSPAVWALSVGVLITRVLHLRQGYSSR